MNVNHSEISLIILFNLNLARQGGNHHPDRKAMGGDTLSIILVIHTLTWDFRGFKINKQSDFNRNKHNDFVNFAKSNNIDPLELFVIHLL